MKLVSSALTFIFLFSCIAMGAVLAEKGALLSCGGLFSWAIASVLCFLVITICCLPVLLLVGTFGYIVSKIVK
jgi:hypothetical protein